MGVGGQRHAPAALLPGLARRLGEPQDGLESAEILVPHRDSIPGLFSP
jgi:hypothetical protein